MKKVAVFGASGFAGTAVVERLLKKPDIDVVAIIHSDGNAWRLSRRKDLALRQVDITVREQVRAVMENVTHVVNCTRGSDTVMLKGLEILLSEAKLAAVEQFVHISSVLIYGDRPATESVHETAAPDPQGNAYGVLKLKQDEMVQSTAGKGLPATIICPPNIIGPYSLFLGGLVEMIKSDKVGLLEGDHACVTVDVDNLAKAIELALFGGDGRGSRYFVTDDHAATWAELTGYLCGLAGKQKLMPLTAQEIESRLQTPPVSYNPLRSLKHLVSSDVREALRKDPLLCKGDMFLRGLIAKLPGNLEDRVRLGVEGPTRVAKVDHAPAINWTFCAAQLRDVTHSCERLQRDLGYTPDHSFAESMSAYVRWYNRMHGYDTGFADILKRLA